MNHRHRVIEPINGRQAAADARAELASKQLDPLAWARDLRAREQGGLRVTAVQRAAWRSALTPSQVPATGPFALPGVPTTRGAA